MQVQMEQSEQTDIVADSRHDLTENIQDKPPCKLEENCDFQCEHRDVDGESKTEETEVCEVLKQEQEEEIHRKQTEDELDPRIQEELEHLNASSEEINRMELELEEERSSYKEILSDLGRKLSALSSKLGTCIEKARPFYEARRVAKEAQQETQKAALSYERAVSMHVAAREMVYVAEQGLGAHKTLDQTWQEMLNHATAKVNEAEEERRRSEREHMRVTQQCQAAEAHVQSLQKSLKKTIMKSKSYFELKDQLNSILEEHKFKVTELEEHLTEAKKRYSFTLQSLEKISEEIHAQREQENSEDGSTEAVGARSPPVGAEAVSCTGTEGGHNGILSKASNWVNGQVAKTQEWVERHREPGWWEREKERLISGTGVCSDSDSGFSCKTVTSDLKKCDSIEHLDQRTDLASFSGEEEEEKSNEEKNDERGGVKQTNNKVEASEKDNQEQLFRPHQRTVSL